MSMSNSEARKRAVESAVQAMKAEVWDEGARTALDHAIRNEDGVTLRLDKPNPYRSEAGR